MKKWEEQSNRKNVKMYVSGVDIFTVNHIHASIFSEQSHWDELLNLEKLITFFPKWKIRN